MSEMTFGGRTEAFRALVGSHNYNLNTPTSDKDYKIFVFPTFDDLYHGKEFSNAKIGQEADYDIHDIRKVTHLWWKSNVNFLEVLFSDDIVINPNLNLDTKRLLEDMFYNKADIARMNIPYLINACIGMHIEKRHKIYQGTEGTKHLVDKFGYDTKQAMHSIRILEVLFRFYKNGFTDFKKAIWFEDDEPIRQFLLDIKSGVYTDKQYLHWADYYLSDAREVQNQCQEKWNEDTKEYLLNSVKQMVKNELWEV